MWKCEKTFTEALPCTHLQILVAWGPEANAVLLVNIRRLEISQSFPQNLPIPCLLVETNLDVVLCHFVTKEENLLATSNWTAGLSQPADGEVTFGF